MRARRPALLGKGDGPMAVSRCSRVLVGLGMALLAAQPGLVAAQDANLAALPGLTPAAPRYSQPQLQQMLAPIALYPDQLVTPILIAAGYPLEVGEAARWVRDPAHAGLAGDALALALE